MRLFLISGLFDITCLTHSLTSPNINKYINYRYCEKKRTKRRAKSGVENLDAVGSNTHEQNINHAHDDHHNYTIDNEAQQADKKYQENDSDSNSSRLYYLSDSSILSLNSS